MEQWVVNLITQTAPGLGGVFVVLFWGQRMLAQMMKDWREDQGVARKECHEAHANLIVGYERVIAGYETHLAAGNALARQLHQQNGEMIAGVRHMSEHLITCQKLVERIHEDNMRLRQRESAA